MNVWKKIAALMLVTVMVLAATGCSGVVSGAGTTWVYELGDTQLPAGQYITSQLVEMSNFLAKVDETLEFEPGEEPATFKDFLALEVDGETGLDFVTRESQRYTKNIFAVREEAQRLGISVPAEYEENIKTISGQAWESERDYFEENGIGADSYAAYNLDAALREELFFHLYDVGGEKEVTDEEMGTFFEEDFAMADVLKIPLFDQFGTDERSPEDFETDMRAMAEDFLERSKKGESVEPLEYEMYLSVLPEEYHEGIEEAPEGNLAFLLSDYTLDNYIEGGEEEIARLVLETTETEPFLYETMDGNIALIVPKELTAQHEAVAYLRPYILIEHKMEEYNTYLGEVTESLGIKTNEKALKRYTPDKIKEQVYTGQPEEEEMYQDDSLVDFDLADLE